MQKNRRFTTKVIVYAAVFAALAAVLGQLLAIRPTESMNFTLDKFVLFLSGMFFGPVVGGMVVFVAEFAGGHLFGRGFTVWLCLPAVLEPVGPGESFVTVYEGKYHQVRRMLASRGMPVIYLERQREGSLELGDLPRGETRELSEEEIAQLL